MLYRRENRMELKQISSLEKVRDNIDFKEISEIKVLRGESFSYQLCTIAEKFCRVNVEVNSSIAQYVKLYSVSNAVLDAPFTENEVDEDFIIKEPCLMPDILIPLEHTKDYWMVSAAPSALWVEVKIPEGLSSGAYEIEIKLTQNIVLDGGDTKQECYSKKIQIDVVDEVIEPQSLIYARWFHVDCVANVHDVEVYSEKHWELIEKYIQAAAEVGVNMILVPVHTPPLDTKEGMRRRCIQLVDIEKKDDKYIFGFDKFKRYIDICKKHGMKYFEIAHMFSQGNSEYSPNIQVTEKGKKDYMFGWHVKADAEEYVSFLKQYIAAIAEEVEKEGISENTYFHISDEPSLKTMETYRRASELIKPYIGKCKTLDALSDYDFYEQGLVEIPVTLISHLKEFLAHKLENQWAYYCCIPQNTYINALLANQLYRVRILGFLLYKYDIKGFLHWGLNFYNAAFSLYTINPYVTTSGDKAFPSGDPFILYPAEDKVYHSIRGKVTSEAIGDMNLCRTLEKYIGRENVIKMIDDEAGMNLYFDNYPKNSEFFGVIREKMISKIRGFHR